MDSLSRFVKKHNELITEKNLRTNEEIIRYFLRENPAITSKTLNFEKHRQPFLDWLSYNSGKIEKSKFKRDFNFDFYTYPLKIVLAKPSLFDKNIQYLEIASYKDVVEKIPLRAFGLWKEMCLGSDGKTYYYREKKRKRSFYANMCVSDFVSLRLPPRGTPLGWNIELLKPQILSFIERYGYPFEDDYKNWMEGSENSFFQYFIHKWLRATDLLILKKNYPTFPRINTQTINLDLVKIPLTHYKELVDEANKNIKQIMGREINSSSCLYDNYNSLYGLILNTILFPSRDSWKQCEYEGCDQWFIPSGKNRRGCCALHASRIKARLFKVRHHLASKK